MLDGASSTNLRTGLQPCWKGVVRDKAVEMYESKVDMRGKRGNKSWGVCGGCRGAERTLKVLAATLTLLPGHCFARTGLGAMHRCMSLHVRAGRGNGILDPKSQI